MKIFKAQAGQHLDEGNVKAGKKSKRESTGLGVRSQDILVKSTDYGIRQIWVCNVNCQSYVSYPVFLICKTKMVVSVA